MIMEHIRFDRLEALATHLESGKLGHDDFCFDEFSVKTDCGTAGCALGECPTLWPNEWGWDHFYPNNPVLNDYNSEGHPWESAMRWFDIEFIEAWHLFHHDSQKTSKYGGKPLSRDATQYEVAENIREFIIVKRTGLNKKE